MNLREQHDALEFFNSLVDSLDEALKGLGHVPVLTRVLGGSFADQKICKDCPHRYGLLYFVTASLFAEYLKILVLMVYINLWHKKCGRICSCIEMHLQSISLVCILNT